MMINDDVMWKPPAAELAEFSYHQLCRQLCIAMPLCRNAATLGKQTEKVSVLCHREFLVCSNTPVASTTAMLNKTLWAQGSFQIIRFIMYPVSSSIQNYHLTISNYPFQRIYNNLIHSPSIYLFSRSMFLLQISINNPSTILIEVALILTFNGQSWAGHMLSSKSVGKLRQPVLRVPGVTRKRHGSEALQVASTVP